MPDFSKRYNQNEIQTEMDAQRAAFGGIRINKRSNFAPAHRRAVNRAKLSTFENEYQNFIKKLKEQKAIEAQKEAEIVIETPSEPVVEVIEEEPKPKKKKAKVIPVGEQVVAETTAPEETSEVPEFKLD